MVGGTVLVEVQDAAQVTVEDRRPAASVACQSPQVLGAAAVAVDGVVETIAGRRPGDGSRKRGRQSVAGENTPVGAGAQVVDAEPGVLGGATASITPGPVVHEHVQLQHEVAAGVQVLRIEAHDDACADVILVDRELHALGRSIRVGSRRHRQQGRLEIRSAAEQIESLGAVVEAPVNAVIDVADVVRPNMHVPVG